MIKILEVNIRGNKLVVQNATLQKGTHLIVWVAVGKAARLAVNGGATLTLSWCRLEHTPFGRFRQPVPGVPFAFMTDRHRGIKRAYYYVLTLTVGGNSYATGACINVRTGNPNIRNN